MESTVENVLKTMERGTNDKLQVIFNRTEQVWRTLHDLLKQHQKLEFFNGTCFLSEVTMNGEHAEAIVILSEQNLDFLLVFDESDVSIDCYFFKHYYNEEGYDVSRLEELLVKKVFEGYAPMIRINQGKKLQESPLRYFNELYSFYITYNAIGEELNVENWRDDEELWLELEEKVHEEFGALFKTEKEKMIRLYRVVKEKGGELSIGELRLYVKSIKIRSNKKENEDKMDAILEKLLQRKLPSLSEEEKEARCYRDSLVLDDGKQQFVILFRTLEDNENHQSELISLYTCMSDDERFTSLSFLVSDFGHYKNHAIYEIHFDDRKQRNDAFYSAGSFSSDIRYFPYLSKFLMKLSQAENAI